MEPSEKLYFPAEQVTQIVTPSSPLVDFPFSQFRHASSDTAPSSSEYFPAGQKMHEKLPASDWNFPVGQSTQTVSEEAAASVLYFPATHVVHIGLPGTEYFPASQFRQVSSETAPSSEEYFPA